MIIGVNLIFILSLILILILFIYWFIFKKNTDNISALSYVKVNNNVPKNELLFKFVDTYSDNKYTDYFNKIINLKLERTPVYVIKKVGNTYEYEVYFYRYDPYRKSKYKIPNTGYLIIILDDYKTFAKKQDFDKLDVKPYNNKLFKENEFIIVSYDVNEKFFNNTELTYNYYFENENEKDLFRYLTKEEDSQGNIVTTNKYGLFSMLFKTEDKKKYLVDLFESDDCIIFYAYKPKTNTHALYYEKSTFDKFILFLEYFKYDKNIIDFCKNKYNNTYDFCFSYDLDDKFNIKKTAIFSIF
jgi:hypothetical protein